MLRAAAPDGGPVRSALRIMFLAGGPLSPGPAHPRPSHAADITGGASSVVLGASREGRLHIRSPFPTMGVDPALNDRFPAVFIDGEKFYYGRDPEFGQFLVSHHCYGKWYWTFKDEQAMVDFLENLPESSRRPTINGQEITHYHGTMPQEEYRRLFEEHRKYLRLLLETRRRHGLTFPYRESRDPWGEVVAFAREYMG
jgi:uncharacterized protein YggL (DUF469 family)